jgi:DNA-binding SARP family transcriptional activator
MKLRIRTLGTLEADIAGAAVTLPPGQRVRGLLAWLALHPGPHPRCRLAGWLWPDVPDDRARASLRSALWALRRALGPGGSRSLVATRGFVGLREDTVTVDIAEFGRLATAGRLREAVALCRGELLYEFGDDWACEAREMHTQHLARVLGKLAAQAAASGNLQEALACARRRAALAPFDEEAARDLILRFAETGDVPASLAAYNHLRDRLRAELGIAPARSTRHLAARMRAGQGGEPGGG